MEEREIALRALNDITEKKLFASFVLDKTFEKYSFLDKRGRAFVTRLVEGTLERMIFLDYAINGVSKTPTVSMDSCILNILRLGAYQIFFMDKVPEHSAVNESVELAKKMNKKSLSGFVNGVLRSLVRKKDGIKFPDKKKNPAGYISAKYSFPKWMVKKIIKTYGKEDTEKMLSAMLEDKPLSLRVNTLKTDAESLRATFESMGMTCKKSTLASDVLILEDAGNLTDTKEFKDGLFYIQDVSSAAASEYYNIKSGMKVLDVCSSPGGKSICAYLLMNGEGSIISRDVSEDKIRRIKENTERLGLSGITAMVWDATRFNEEDAEKYDLVIADLPCSGLGVMGRKTDIKYHVSKESVEELITLQRKILSVVNKYVRSGGYLIYSTCTLNAEENEENAKWIEENLPFYKEDEKLFVPGMSEEYCDGFYVARFKKW
ncbi:MAG: 16S rRNA (cytosine(967)-C(5))-methyltransferase RsmB [Eubacterium sp.]|nr:16S rRNA (cytosine(967)-C(5))-methyltransferase RsmB [Eubacterium sp.]